MPVTKALVDQLLADCKQAVCPNCEGTGFYDNRDDPKRKPKAPLFKCKNKDCNTGEGYAFGVFDRDVKKFAPESANAPSAKSAATKKPPSWKQVRVAFAECVSLALKGGEQIGAKMGVALSPEHITTMTNSLMMTRERTGCWPLEVPSERAKVEAVAPKSALKPRDDDPYAAEPSDDDSLPF